MKGIKSTIGAAGAVMLAMAGGSAWADNGPGCGLGHLIFKGKTGLFAHVVGATFNGTAYNQTFGLSSGTSDCDPNAQVNNDKQRKVFVAENYDELARDVALGGGDRLTALAVLSGVAPADRDTFYRTAQQEFNALFKADSTSDDMLASLDNLIAGAPESVR
jgi:hypothetical protein